MTHAAGFARTGKVAMRRNPVPVAYEERQDFTLGEAISVREGADMTLVVAGAMVAHGLDAAEITEGEPTELFAKDGMSPDHIAEAAMRAMALKVRRRTQG